MDLTPHIRCGLRIMVALAVEPMRPATVEGLARAAKAPVALVRSTLVPLEEARLVQGVEGGYRLGFHKRAIHVSDVIDALRTDRYPEACPLGVCKPQARCALCWALVEAEVAAGEVLHRQTLADIARVMDAHNVRTSAELAG